MTVKASIAITISSYRDIQSVTRYYKLQASTASTPSKPTANPPSGWSTTEPSYSEGSTNTLYFCDLTVFSNGEWEYSAVSKSSSYEAAKTAYNKAVAANNTATAAKDSVDKMPNYIASRGENLVTNGTCLLGDNTNFSRFQYDGKETYYAGGSFKHSGTEANKQSDEYIPVDVEQKYELSYYIKSSSASARMYDFICSYDIDKNKIDPAHVMFIPGSTTTLAKELKKGDTKVYLTSVSGFNKTTNHNAQRGLIFWNYTNSKGYTYEPETYSRNQSSSLWSDSSAFDETENTITLDSAWTHGTFPTGTPVSQCDSGSDYIYGNGYYSVTANTWTKKTAYWNGVGKNNAGGKFREGTAFVKIGWRINYGSSTACDTWLSTISLTQSANNSKVSELVSKVDVEYYLSTSATSLSGGSWVTTAPTWVNGKYMWSRTKTVKGDGTVTYSPSQNGTCIAGATGATGATGTSVSSITEEYYLSTSKTTQTGGSWTTTPPTWESGKYIWTRSKIVYTNPSSTAYTTPICDTSWEAANEVDEKLNMQMNYFWSDNEGAHVAADPSGAGNNVLIDSDSVDIRNGTTVNASFSSDNIYLGKNSVTSMINLCKGAGYIVGSESETGLHLAIGTEGGPNSEGISNGGMSLEMAKYGSINAANLSLEATNVLNINSDVININGVPLGPTAVTVTKVAGDTYLTMNANNVKKMYKHVSGYVYLTTNAVISAGNNLLRFPEGSRPASTQYLPLFNISEGKLTYATIDSNGYFKNGGALTSGKVYIANPNYFTA